ncbi:hypothetical protein [Botrimarina hoheduenensis]|uniref:Uncharacterized protein n=1 Tax=Botrimarina hoheduenensis TaxID=2528000 RepID=A0A5C5W865_9BACT|nr:hypothetical protein [Botrimarina hoheduenensis]TWT46453.1 hypothetical protein Pla111_15490 [Botrimarina hoheduenensis]
MTPVETAADPAQQRVVTEPWTAFAAWAGDTLGLKVAFDGVRYRLQADRFDEPPAEASRASTRSGRSWLRRQSAPHPTPSDNTAEEVVADQPADLLKLLLQRLRDLPEPVAARPRDQPEAVHEITKHLFSAYKLEGGSVHVAGCRLEDRPFVRLSWPTEGDEGSPRVAHAFYDLEARAIAAPQVASLGLAKIAPLPTTASRSEHRTPEAAIVAAQAAATRDGAPLDAVTTLVWVKHAEGVLRFEFGDEALDTPFVGWARTLQALPVVCPVTGSPTFHLATVEGGTIVAAEQIGTCCVSGKRHPLPDLVRCSVTGRLAEPEWMGVCSVSGNAVLDTELIECPRCGERVAPQARTAGGCLGCDSPQRVTAQDPRLEAVLEKHPQLRCKRWLLAETASVLVLEAPGWLRTRLVTVDRETLAIKRIVESARFSGVWRPISNG